jgi:hypothetical protein
MSISTDGSAAELPSGHVLVSTTCWSCDAELSKEVRLQSRNHQRFAWSCVECDVEWIGPGTELRRSA